MHRRKRGTDHCYHAPEVAACGARKQQSSRPSTAAAVEGQKHDRAENKHHIALNTRCFGRYPDRVVFAPSDTGEITANAGAVPDLRWKYYNALGQSSETLGLFRDRPVRRGRIKSGYSERGSLDSSGSPFYIGSLGPARSNSM